MAEPRTSDSFGAFLRSVKASEGDPSNGTSLKLLQALERGSVPLDELIKLSGMTFDRFAEALQSLRKLNLLTVQTQAGREVAELTPEGAQLAKLANV